VAAHSQVLWDIAQCPRAESGPTQMRMRAGASCSLRGGMLRVCAAPIVTCFHGELARFHGMFVGQGASVDMGPASRQVSRDTRSRDSVARRAIGTTIRPLFRLQSGYAMPAFGITMRAPIPKSANVGMSLPAAASARSS
jgi:hypothetical protein